ncbi:MAG TPA: response regulator [Lacunisphaera sp.]|nr:response regulator [Lacunisphaera sp.]
MKPPLPKTVLIIEDDAGLSSAMAETAKQAGFQTCVCTTAAEGLARALADKPAVIFGDVHLAQGDGRTVLAKLRADPKLGDCQFVLMTGDWVGAPQRASVELEADAYLAKPFTVEEFATLLVERYEQANL